MSILKPNMSNYYWGVFAEYIIILLYKLRLYTILHHRKKTWLGEIDIIALKRNCLVFIEVKARKGGLAEGIISSNQQRRLRRAALLFIGKNPKFANHDIRFDLAIISPYKLPIVIRNAW